MASKKKPAANDKRVPAWRLSARPDAIDFRDRVFQPNVALAPAASLFPVDGLPLKNQQDTMACTGFALSLVVEHLLRKAGREAAPAISPYMLYSMARRYDEFPGSVADEGSSLRGVLKGWFKHGACRLELFPALEMPKAPDSVDDDWWFDAVRRPLGAYYRILPKQLTDMHAALNEVGVLLASCGCHAGWDEGVDVEPMAHRPASFDEVWTIPVKRGTAAHAGHAFAIVGYNERGFLIQNSWGTDWGSRGHAILTYDDWLKNAMDCWVAQLGVVTQEHRLLARSETLRSDRKTGKVSLAADEVLRNREIAPFVIDLGNNGALSNSGEFRTRPDDVRAIVDVQLERTRQAWGLADNEPIDVCLYAHGGLTGEKAAADIAARWISLLYEKRIFPIFLMWETDFWSTICNLIEDRIQGVPRVAGAGLGFERWWNQRLERALARPGTAVWGEMKENANLISFPKGKVPDEMQAGAVLLYEHFKRHKRKNVRMHFVGHSAGSIVGTHMIERLAGDGMRFESVSFMAPAVRADTFWTRLKPLLDDGRVARFQQFMLSDRAEEDDPTCGPYRRSLLYLVSESFEGGATTPILGMERHFQALLPKLKNTTVHVAPGPKSAASTHGGFDEDMLTQQQVVKFIRQP